MSTEPSNDKPATETAEGVVRRRRKAEEDDGPPVETSAEAEVADATVTSPREETATPVADPAAPAEAEASPEGAMEASPPAETAVQPAQAAPQEPAPGGPAEPATASEPGPRLAGRPKTIDDEPADFATLLDAGEIRDQAIEQGMFVEGRLVAFGGEWAFVDLGAKTEGILAAEELKDEHGELTRGIGDPIEAFVVSLSGGEIRLSFVLGRQIRDAEALFDALEAGIPVEGKVVGTNKGGFEVRIAGRRAFCPISQIDIEYTEDPSAHVGKTYTFRLKELSRDGKRIVVSRADYLREEREAQKRELLEGLAVGDEIDGAVTSIQDYGAFVDLGGVEGLVHISELSWTRVQHPSEVVQVGEPVTVKVLSVKETEKGERISLSLRQTVPHPWVAVGTKFVEGETYSGTVTRLEPYGAFVELGPGVEGLVHVSELSWARRINHPKEILTEGQPLRVYLKSIDEKRRRIALSVKALERDPWADARQRYPAGSQVEGIIEKIQPFGIFVELEPGLTALIPASESNTGTGADLRREFEPGQRVTATVLAVEPDRKRMSLSLKAAAELKDQVAIKEFFDEQKQSEEKGGGFGTLGDLFRDKLK